MKQLLVALLLVGCAGVDPEEIESDVDWSEAGKADSVTGPLRVVEVHVGAPSYVELENVGTEGIDVAGWAISFSRRRLPLVALEGQGHLVQPGELVLVVEQGGEPSGLPAWLPRVTTAKDLSEALRGSQRLVVRDAARALSDRADATVAAARPSVGFERSGNKFAASARGGSPGERNGSDDSMAAYFANPPFDAQDPLAPRLAALVDGARQTVDAAFYQLDQPAVVDALERAARRGVRVRLVTDTTYLNDPAYAPAYAQLRGAGVPIIDDKRTARMHDKFVVVDGETVWTGSYNPDVDATSKFIHADNVVMVKSRALAALHETEFEQMFGGAFGPAKTVDSRHDVFVHGTRIEVYFSPRGGAKPAIVAQLVRAADEIHFCLFSFYQPEIGDAMIARLHAGVDVRGVVDDTGATAAGSQVPRLLNAGAEIRRPTYELFLHHKFVVVDHDGTDPVVITGSYNFSDRADQQNDEALYVIHDRAMAEAYHKTYSDLWDETGTRSGVPTP